MVAAVLEYLAPRPGGVYVDLTLGGGGHARAIEERAGPGGRVIGMDRDPAALDAVREQQWGPGFIAVHGTFSDLPATLAAQGIATVDGVLMDLGVSSRQLVDPERGFSFQAEGPLDMRMDPGADAPAADLVNRLPEDELARILWEYGEERWSRRIAARIVEARRRKPLRTTGELVEVVCGAVPRKAWPRRIHPATRTFQGLRIAVNQELEHLRTGLTVAAGSLARGGRLVVISYHSLEDRITKTEFRRMGRSETTAGAEFRILTPKPVTPEPDEIQTNARARSAKLRAVEYREEASDDCTCSSGNPP